MYLIIAHLQNVKPMKQLSMRSTGETHYKYLHALDCLLDQRNASWQRLSRIASEKLHCDYKEKMARAIKHGCFDKMDEVKQGRRTMMTLTSSTLRVLELVNVNLC